MDYIISQQIFIGLENVLKTSSRHVLKRSSTLLQRNSLCLPRRLEDVLQGSLGRQKIVTLETYARHPGEMSRRHLQDVLQSRHVQDVMEIKKNGDTRI